MAELIADLVLHATAVKRGSTLESGQQSASGQRPGPETAKEFWYWDDVIVYVAGVPITIPARQKAQVYGTGGTTFDLTASRWISFIVNGSGQHYITTAENWTTLAMTVDIVGIEYHTRSNWRRHQPFATSTGTPPIPPILIDSGGGGIGYVIGYGSNPQQLHAGYGPNTKVLSLWFLGAGSRDGGSSYHILPVNDAQGNWPEAPSGAPVYTDGSNGWNFWRFDPHAQALDHWPIPYSPYDATNNPTDANGVYPIWPSSFKRWEHWKSPVRGLTDNHGRTSDDTVWPDHPAFPTQALDGNIAPQGIWTVGSVPTEIAYENVLVRGKFTLPDIGTASVTAIDFFMANDFSTTVDDITLNDSHLFLSGLTAGSDVQGDQGPFDITAQGSKFRWNAENLIALLVRGFYTDPANGNKTSATTYISFTFTIDYGTGPYVPAPTGWQGGGFDDSGWSPSTPGDPGSFFGRGVADSITYGDIGLRSRYYSRSHFTIPAHTYTGATLAITARTGIGSIVLNGHTVDSRDETIDLWGTSTVLTYTIPLAWLFTDGTTDNVLSVQAYTADGHTALDFLLSLSQ